MNYKPDLFNVIAPIVVDNGSFFINDLFNKKFGGNAPPYKHHMVAFYKSAKNGFLPVTYTHFFPYKNVILVGGAMTDGSVFKQMSGADKKIITDSGGIYLNILKYAFEYFGSQCDAFFGHVNDERALQVDLEAGFIKTQYPYLVVKYHKSTSSWKKKRLVNMAHKIGPF